MIRIQWEQTDWKHALISLFTFFVITIHHTWGKLLIFRKKLLLGWLSTNFSYHHSPCRLLLALFTKSVTTSLFISFFLYYHTLDGYPFSYYHQTAHCCSSVRSIAKHDKEHGGWCTKVISKEMFVSIFMKKSDEKENIKWERHGSKCLNQHTAIIKKK
jgi:lysylphosphatidylglycerol synthetase-like protein (DUF2156 family)